VPFVNRMLADRAVLDKLAAETSAPQSLRRIFLQPPVHRPCNRRSCARRCSGCSSWSASCRLSWRSYGRVASGAGAAGLLGAALLSQEGRLGLQFQDAAAASAAGESSWPERWSGTLYLGVAD